MGATSERELASEWPVPAWLVGVVVWPTALGLATGLALAAVRHWDQVASLVVTNRVEAAVRAAFVAHAVLGALAGPLAVLLLARCRRPRTAPLLERAASLGRRLGILTPLACLPYLLHPELWQQATLYMEVVALAAAAAFAWLLAPGGDDPSPAAVESRRERRAWAGAALAATVAYVVYVAYWHVLHHWSLGTHAYDLGIMENVFWNSVNGDLFASALEREGNHLGVHTSFIYMLLFPLYALLPRTETLLVVQALFVGGAALPLFLLARRWQLPSWVAFLLVAVYLTHPAVGGANFYDFHELAFMPCCLFLVVLAADRAVAWPFWLAVVALLAVKEDMAIMVALVGLVLLAGPTRRRGAALIVVGVGAYLLLQHVVIPHFAGGAHSYAWYYADMIPAEEGPAGLVKTVLANPLYALRYPLTGAKALFVLQIFAPLAFLPFVRARGALLLAYGLVVCLFSSRGPLYELGFQYAFLLVAPALVGALLALRAMPAERRRRFLLAAAALAGLNFYHHGLVSPRQVFKAGFGTVDFAYSADERARYEELLRFIALIPADASVTANEELVPHVARRRRVETLRYAQGNAGRSYDYYLLLQNEGTRDQLVIEYPEVASLAAYELLERGDQFVLLRRRGLGGGAAAGG